MVDTHVVILAAGKGTRMKSELPKALHVLAGAPIIDYVVRTAEALRPKSTTVVVGHGADLVRAALARRTGLQFVVQNPQLGTAHALLQAAPVLRGKTGLLVLLSGDVPLLRAGTLHRLIETHEKTRAAATILTAVADRPDGYGRIVRVRGRVARVVEERDASPAQRKIREINSGIYAFEISHVFDAIGEIGRENAQGEYYLPDLVVLYRRRKLTVADVVVEDVNEIRGINSRTELAEVGTLVRQAKNRELMEAGVTIEDPATTYIGPDVKVGIDTIIHPGVILEGATEIGSACEIHAGVRIADSTLGSKVTVKNFSVIIGARISSGASIGPFAHLRPESDVRENAHVGNFVELKKTVLGAGSKANHLAYLGDATIGERVNIGAGTITCNYDGERKHPTIIDDDVFIGSDSQLIAPVRVGRGAYVAAGSSITDSVPPGSLAIARARQVNKDGWVTRKKDKK